jgi:hypothetical protein
MSSDDFNYYRERARIERERADQSSNTLAAEIHLELAGLYEKLIRLEQQPRPTLHIAVSGNSGASIVQRSPSVE